MNSRELKADVPLACGESDMEDEDLEHNRSGVGLRVPHRSGPGAGSAGGTGSGPSSLTQVQQKNNNGNKSR